MKSYQTKAVSYFLLWNGKHKIQRRFHITNVIFMLCKARICVCFFYISNLHFFGNRWVCIIICMCVLLQKKSRSEWHHHRTSEENVRLKLWFSISCGWQQCFMWKGKTLFFFVNLKFLFFSSFITRFWVMAAIPPTTAYMYVSYACN